MKELFRLENVSARFGTNEVLRGMSLSIDEKERIAICGPSGSGKTTLLRCLNLLEHIEEGVLYFRGEKIIEASAGRPKVLVNENRYRTRVGIVFQQYNLWHNKSIIDNLIEGPVYVKKIRREEAIQRARELCQLFDIEYAIQDDDSERERKKYPGQLSGGQQQRVALARALAMEPDVLLLDEITSALDPPLAAEILSYLKKINEMFHITLVFVTHYIEFAKSLATRLLFMKEGRIVIDTSIDELERYSENPDFKRYLEPMKQLV